MIRLIHKGIGKKKTALEVEDILMQPRIANEFYDLEEVCLSNSCAL